MSSNDEVRTQVRLPARLHAQVVAAAKAAGRSMNAEISHRLLMAFQSGAKGRGVPVQTRAEFLVELVRGSRLWLVELDLGIARETDPAMREKLLARVEEEKGRLSYYLRELQREQDSPQD